MKYRMTPTLGLRCPPMHPQQGFACVRPTQKTRIVLARAAAMKREHFA